VVPVLALALELELVLARGLVLALGPYSTAALEPLNSSFWAMAHWWTSPLRSEHFLGLAGQHSRNLKKTEALALEAQP
jgi:hypothetical protein